MKKLLALAAVAAMGISVVGATPQTQFKAGQTQVDAGALYTQTDGSNWQSDRHWNGTAGVTHAFTNRVALQYGYTGLHTTDSLNANGQNSETRIHEVNIIESLNPHVALYQGYANFDGGFFSKNLGNGIYRNNERNHVAQFGAILKTNIGSRLEAYAKGALGTKNTSIWEAGLGVKAAKDLDLNVGYKYINTAANQDQNVSWKGLTTGISYRFGGRSKKTVAPVATLAPAPDPVAPAPQIKKADYYTTSIYFDSDVDTPRADQAPNLAAALNAANQYPNDAVKLVGNADSSYTAEYNQGLSERRVQSVAQYLVNNGVNSNRLVGLANGDRKPADSNATPAGRAENRRVDVFVNR